jgi:caa(3)-type oxidase subunit IV
MAQPDAHGHGEPHGHSGHHPNYIKIYFILLGLLGVSIAGPLVGIKAVTLITAFGIAVVKAYMVASNFMHLNVEKKYVSFLLLGALALMAVFYAGTSGDVMNHRGRNWENVAANAETRRALAAEAASSGGEHGEPGEAHEGH